MYNGGGRGIDAHEELVVLAVEHGSRGEYFASPGLNVFCTRRKKGCFMTARRRGIDRSRGRGWAWAGGMVEEAGEARNPPAGILSSTALRFPEDDLGLGKARRCEKQVKT